MRFRRTLLALALSTTVGLTTACAQDSGSSTQSAAPTSASASSAASATAAASPAGDLKANTEAVCKSIVAAYDKEKPELTAALGEVGSPGTELEFAL